MYLNVSVKIRLLISDTFLSCRILLNRKQILVHFLQHLLEIEEKVEYARRITQNFDKLAGFWALDQILEHVDQVINGAEE